MPGPQEQGLLQAIVESPEDDTPRLVYADWLEEHGEPGRAELIRVSVALERLDEDDPRGTELEARRHALFAEHGTAGVPALTRHGVRPFFDRGLVYHIELTAATFLSKAEALFRAAPTIRSVDLHGAARHMRRLAACPHLARLTALSLRSSSLTDHAVKVLAASPHLANLRSLDLFDNRRIGPAGAAALAASPHLANLTTLELGLNRLGDEGARRLAASPHLRRLTSLKVGYNGLGPEGAVALLASPVLARVTTLDLGFNEIGPAGAEALAGASLGPLADLNLRSCELDTGAVVGLVASPHLAGLLVLDLGGNYVGIEGARALGRSSHLARLTRLDLALDHGEMGDTGVEAIAAAPHWGELRRLDLGSDGIHADGARALAGSPSLANLRTLDLSNNPIGDAGAVALARSPHLTRLRDLGLYGCGIGDEGACALAASANLAQLTTLNLRNNKVGAEGFRALAGSPHLGRLAYLHVSAGEADHALLAARFGDRVHPG